MSLRVISKKSFLSWERSPELRDGSHYLNQGKENAVKNPIYLVTFHVICSTKNFHIRARELSVDMISTQILNKSFLFQNLQHRD